MHQLPKTRKWKRRDKKGVERSRVRRRVSTRSFSCTLLQRLRVPWQGNVVRLGIAHPIHNRLEISPPVSAICYEMGHGGRTCGQRITGNQVSSQRSAWVVFLRDHVGHSDAQRLSFLRRTNCHGVDLWCVTHVALSVCCLLKMHLSLCFFTAFLSPLSTPHLLPSYSPSEILFAYYFSKGHATYPTHQKPECYSTSIMPQPPLFHTFYRKGTVVENKNKFPSLVGWIENSTPPRIFLSMLLKRPSNISPCTSLHTYVRVHFHLSDLHSLEC